MRIETEYQGSQTPFRGDRIFWLRSLPVGAIVTQATIALAPPQGDSFEELIDFNPSSPPQGVNILSTKDYVEVDFHSRQTLVAVKSPDLTGASLQIELGGIYVDINNRGTVKTGNDAPFTLQADGRLPTLTVTRFRLTHPDKNPKIQQLAIRAVPTNITVRLGQLPPFWTRLGELSALDTSPDFTTVLNTFLLTALTENGFYSIPFEIHSDSLARLNVKLQLEYFLQQQILPPHLPEITLAYDFSTLPSVAVDLTTLKLPQGAIPLQGQAQGQMQGEFQPTRIAKGSIGEDPSVGLSQTPHITAKVSPQITLAQPLQSEQEIAVVGIDLSLAKTKTGLAGLNIAIQKDADGKPSGEVLASADVKVGKPLPDQSNWGSASLPTPFRVEAKKIYWLVLQSQVGEAEWNIQRTDLGPGLQMSDDGGFSWRLAAVVEATPPLAALFRLRNLPDRFTIPVQLQIGQGPGAIRRRFDEFNPLSRIEFLFDFSQKLQDYLTSPASTPSCGTTDLIVNGNFINPAPDDANRNLFGFDIADDEKTYTPTPDISLTAISSASSSEPRRPEIAGSVNLSRGVNLTHQRFITVSFDDRPPLRINCAGSEPAHTQLSEIVEAINLASRRSNAAEVGESQNLVISSTEPNAQQPRTSIRLYPWCSSQVPNGWQGASEQIRRLKFSSGQEQIVTVVGVPSLFSQDLRINDRTIPLACFPKVSPSTTNAQSASISQRIPCAEGCSYLLQFAYGIVDAGYGGEGESPEPPPFWEVAWFKENQLLQTDGETIEPEPRRRDQTSTSKLQSVRLKAPSQATQAEVRFGRPAPGGLWLTGVSLIPTSETLDNANFTRRDRTGLPLGWELISGSIVEQESGVLLLDDGSEAAILMQTVEVNANSEYELQVIAQIQTDPVGDMSGRSPNQRSRLELQWMGQSPISPAIQLFLDGFDFPIHRWRGSVPSGTTQAAIRLIQPPGSGHLLVQSVSFSQVELVSIPLTFLSEAPGQLTVSNLKVTYDLPLPPEPPSTSNDLILKTPTAPARSVSSSLALVTELSTPSSTSVDPNPTPPPEPPPPPPAPPMRSLTIPFFTPKNRQEPPPPVVVPPGLQSNFTIPPAQPPQVSWLLPPNPPISPPVSPTPTSPTTADQPPVAEPSPDPERSHPQDLHLDATSDSNQLLSGATRQAGNLVSALVRRLLSPSMTEGPQTFIRRRLD